MHMTIETPPSGVRRAAAAGLRLGIRRSLAAMSQQAPGGAR